MIAVLVAAAWWPIDSFWQSDDWIAIHYASSLGALRDFAGNHYDLPGLVWFYRPLVTVTFVINALIGGADPLFAHATNAVFQGVAAMAIGLVACRFWGALAGWSAAMVWGLAPVHAGAVFWAVGRTGTLTTIWLALAAWWLLRWIDGYRHSRKLALLCAVLALCTKETAMVMPAIAAILCFAMATPGTRAAQAMRGSWPFALVLAVYLAGRYLLFGQVLGGYGSEIPAAGAAAAGLATWAGRVLNPLAYLTTDGLDVCSWCELPQSALSWRWLGYAPALLAVAVLGVRRRWAVLASLTALFAVCVVPSVQFWSIVDNPKNLRYFGLAAGAVAALYAAAGGWVAVLAIACGVLPLLESRRDYETTWAECSQIHRMISREARELEPGPLFIHGLPRQNLKHDVVAYHYGVDRILAPPFGAGRHRVFALRPLTGGKSAPLPYGERRGLPHGVTLSVIDPTIVHRPRPDGRPRVGVTFAGDPHVTSPLLAAINEGRAQPAFLIDGPRQSHYRITLFSGGGYISAVLPNEAPAGTDGGRVSLQSWLLSQSGDSHVVLDLRLPTAMDLDIEFPVLVEGGELASPLPAVAPTFQALQVARQFVWLRFDRDYAVFMKPAG